MNKTKINVAVVDNDKTVACALGRLLRASGFSVLTFPSAETFLAAAPHLSPDCLVLDIALDGMSGLELQQKLSENNDATPIIFVTAHDASDIQASAQQIGYSAYLLKPVSGKLLTEAINQAVKQTVYCGAEAML